MTARVVRWKTSPVLPLPRPLTPRSPSPYPQTGATPEVRAAPTSAYQRQAGSLDDVVVVSACRTPLCRSRRGGFKDTPVEDLITPVLKETLKRTGVEPEAVGDIVFGSVMGPSSQRANELRIAMLLAGFPHSVPVHTVNRQCSSGLQAIASVAAAIRAGYYTVGIAGGVETMTKNPMSWDGAVNPKVTSCQEAADCLLPMGITSENVTAKYGLTREDQDTFAAASHRKAFAARAAGKFKDEIVPVETVLKGEDGTERRVVISEDDGIRGDVTAASLGKLKPAFKKGGLTTAGSSSQTTDGASAVMLMTRREALRRGLPVELVFRSFAVAGVPPAIMGVGPVAAIPPALKAAGLTTDDIDVYEINEAFASQALYSVRTLGLDADKVNPNGGAIALGHPLGCTGSRQTATLLYELKRRGKAGRFGVVSMCIGSGMGAAAVFERDNADDEIRAARPAANPAAGLSRQVDL